MFEKLYVMDFGVPLRKINKHKKFRKIIKYFTMTKSKIIDRKITSRINRMVFVVLLTSHLFVKPFSSQTYTITGLNFSRHSFSSLHTIFFYTKVETKSTIDTKKNPVICCFTLDDSTFYGISYQWFVECYIHISRLFQLRP